MYPWLDFPPEQDEPKGECVTRLGIWWDIKTKSWLPDTFSCPVFYSLFLCLQVNFFNQRKLLDDINTDRKIIRWISFSKFFFYIERYGEVGPVRSEEKQNKGRCSGLESIHGNPKWPLRVTWPEHHGPSRKVPVLTKLKFMLTPCSPLGLVFTVWRYWTLNKKESKRESL